MERVLWPMEPVEPRMASFFTQLFSQIWEGWWLDPSLEAPQAEGVFEQQDAP
jgi:hypothetical protein